MLLLNKRGMLETLSDKFFIGENLLATKNNTDALNTVLDL